MGGLLEPEEVFGSGIGSGGVGLTRGIVEIGVTRRIVENGRLNVRQRRIWGREELGRRER